MADRKLVTTIHINSRDRISGTPSNFQVRFTPTITKCRGVAVKSVCLPYSWYIITSSNNVLTYSENHGTNLTVTIPPGNYTASNLASTLQTQLNNNTLHSYVYTVSISPTTYNTTINITTSGGNASYKWTQNASLARILGWDATDTAYVQTAISPYAANVTGFQKAYILSRALTSSASAIAYSAGIDQPILTEVPVDVGPNNTIIYLPTVEYWEGFSMNLDLIDIQVVDDSFTELDLNGIDWNISICIERENAFV